MLLFLSVIVIIFVAYVKWSHSYWKRRGITQMETEFLFGNARKPLTGTASFGESVLERYKAIKALDRTGGGVYAFFQPIYYPVDPRHIKMIFQEHFPYFMNHGLFHHKKDVLSMNLFNMENEPWRILRAKLTPTFTSGKIKMMFETLVEKTDGLEKLVGKYAKNHEPTAIKEALGRFTTDIIASCAFGIECNSLEDPDDAFRTYGRKVFQPDILRFWLVVVIPWGLLGNAGFKFNGGDVTKFFTKIVKDTIKTREAGNIFRKDFMQLLLQLKNQQLSHDSQNKFSYNLTEDEIIAQSFVFFLAGFETSSTAMTFALLELAQNPDIQEKLRNEINAVLEKHEGNVTYDAVMSLSYLEKVINETMRKFPPVPAIPRVCTKDYTIPGTSKVIEKGTRVHIPIWGLHRDPEYYPDPEKFDPERFNPENIKKRPDFTFLPFGEGPRMCIGLRFGMLQTKVGLISLIRNFRFSLNKKTAVPIRMAPFSVISSVHGEVWLDVKQIEEISEVLTYNICDYFCEL